jgi:aryl-alcohol dehydrogenase-like predicted oxidoreductase
MGLSSAYGKIGSNEERFKILDRALELGSTFWDTSDVCQFRILYDTNHPTNFSDGDSEDFIGSWFKHSGKRDEIFLCTKFGMTRGPNGLNVRGDSEYVKEACNKSLSRLGIKKIDLYLCHRPDPKTPIEETVKALAELKKEGKIGAIGLSEVSAATLRRAHKVHPISAIQVEYSPFAMDIEDSNIGLLDLCRELGIAIIAYSPLGRGFLTGQITSPDDFEDGDFRKNAPRYSKENFPKNLELVSSLEKVAKTKGCTSGQLTLAWLLGQGDDIIPIP